jgi:cell division protein FtsB
MRFIISHRLEMIVSMCCMALLVYFGFQATAGGRGFAYREALGLKKEQLNAQLASLTSQRLALEGRVQQLRPGTVDQDLVDEMARRQLNMGTATDFVVRLPQ